jgi:hypothetical protein
MEGNSVVIPLLGKTDKILDGLWSLIREKKYGHLAHPSDLEVSDGISLPDSPQLILSAALNSV